MVNDKISLDLSQRTVTGKKVSRLRKDGQTPGVVYGHGVDTINVQAPSPLVEKVVHQAGQHNPVYLKLDGKNRIAMIKNIDYDPVKRKVRHIALHTVNQNEQVEAEIPIRLVGEGESVAEKAGLVVLQTLETIKVHALPTDLPDALEISIVDLAEPHQQVTVANITLPQGVELNDAENVQEIVVASVYEPSALQAANEAAGGDVEPEEEAEAVEGVETEHGQDTPQDDQSGEDRPGGKSQKEPKPSQTESQ